VPTNNAAIRVVVAEDSLILREGLVGLLEQAKFDVVAEAGDLPSLMAAVDREEPDVALVDIRMPPTQTDEGLQAARHIRLSHPETGVLVLSQYLDEEYALRVIRESPSAVGYMMKDSVARLSDVALAVRRVADGGTVVDPHLVRELVERRTAGEALTGLSPTEHVVLGLMAEGLSNSGIAAHLVVSQRTVEGHARAILAKLDIPNESDVNRRVRAVLAYMQARAKTAG
jgi:DNA-binding NarL/FixJ family response regulator